MDRDGKETNSVYDCSIWGKLRRLNVQPAGVISKTRYAWIDYAKAIAISLVVFGHVNSGIAKTPGISMGAALSLLNDVVYSVHIPLFFVLGGYVASLLRNQGPSSFARALLWGVAVPYVIWSVLWISFKAGMHDHTANPVAVAALLHIPWKPIAHMWFLYHLLFIRSGWFVLGRNGTNLQMAGAAGASALLSAVAAGFGPEWFALSFFLQNFALFGFGMLALPSVMARLAEWGALRTAAIAAVLYGIAFLAGKAAFGGALPFLLGVTGAIAIIGVTRILPEPRGLSLRLLAFTGEASLAIYVMHLFVTTPMRHLLAHFGVLTEPNLLVIATAAGIVIPAAAYWVALQMSAATGQPIARYAGLGTASLSNYLPAGAFGVGTQSLAADPRS